MTGWALAVDIENTTVVVATAAGGGSTVHHFLHPESPAGPDDPTALLRAALTATGRTDPPNRLVLVHAPDRTDGQLAALRTAAGGVGLPDPQFVARPVAAARVLAPDLAPGGHLAVVDVGAVAVCITVVGRTPAGFAVDGPSGGLTPSADDPPAALARAASYELLAVVARAGLSPERLTAVHVIGAGPIVAGLAETLPTIVRQTPVVAGEPADVAVRGALADDPGAAGAAPGPARRSRGRTVAVVVAAMVVVAVGTSAALLVTHPWRRPATGAAAGSSTVYVLTAQGVLPGSLIPVDAGSAGRPIPVGNAPNTVAITTDGSHAYVVSASIDAMTPVDLRTGTAGTPVKVGSRPTSVSVTPDGRRLYVSNSGSGTVTPIDAATNTPGMPIHIGDLPGIVGISPDGRTAYAFDHPEPAPSAGIVVPIDTTTNTPRVPIQVGIDPVAMVFTPDGRTAYVLNWGGSARGSVTPIDTATGATRPAITVTTGLQPRKIAITPDGRTVYVAGVVGNAVNAIDTATEQPQPMIRVSESTGLAITPDGRTVYVSTNQGAVVPVTAATGVPRTPIRVSGHPTLITISPDGRTVYVASATDEGGGTVTPIDIATDRAGQPITVAGQPIALVAKPARPVRLPPAAAGATPPAPAASTTGPSKAGASSAVPSTAGGPPAQFVGPGVDCGPDEPMGSTPTELFVTHGALDCAAAHQVLDRYRSPSVPKQGSGGFAQFDGWTCAHQSVAGIEETHEVIGCERNDHSVALVTRIPGPPHS